MNDYDNYFEVIMGLDITARIVKIDDVKMVKEYQKLNWPKVQAGEMTESDYGKNYPKFASRSINASEYGIRNFWGLREFFIKNLGINGETVFVLNRNEIETTLKAADTYKLPDIDYWSYLNKCDEVATVCRTALSECDFDTEVVEFFFCY